MPFLLVILFTFTFVTETICIPSYSRQPFNILQGSSPSPRSHRRYSKCPVRYYDNSSATFHVPILSSGDIEPNPGPSNNERNSRRNENSNQRQALGISFNARSIRNKLTEIESFIQLSFPDIIAITETWLAADDVVHSCFAGYEIFRRDRPLGRGGGVLAAVKPELSPKRKTNLESDTIEMLSIEINSRSDVKWLLCLIYRPPSAPVEFWDHLQTVVDELQIASTEYHGIIFTGDFNVDWANQQLPGVQHLSRITSLMDMTQVIDDVTRRSPDDPLGGTIIDLLFTNSPHLTTDIDIISNPVSSDHDAISFCLKLTKAPPSKQIIRDYFQYDKVDTEHFNNILSYTPWDLFMDDNDIESSWEGFLDLFEAAVHDCIPRKRSRRKSNPWITSDIKKLIRKKQKAFKDAKRSATKELWEQYKHLRNEVKCETNKAFFEYVNRLFTHSSDNKKRFFAFVRSQRKNPGPTMIDNNGIVEYEPSNIAEAFGQYFSSLLVGNSNDETCRTFDDNGFCELIPHLQGVEISDSDVLEVINSLKNDKSPGPDNITPRLLKLCSQSITPILRRLFVDSLSQGTLPMSWKKANITPVHKSGDTTSVCNYRPIALTSVVCKIIETLITKAIHRHISEYCLLDCNQHGFVKGRSCVTQLMSIVQTWLRFLDKPSPPKIDVIFFDFTKAFDLMPHDILLRKLKSQFFISGKLWFWIQSFLTNRQQRVLYKGATSTWFDVLSGIPQGSVLGPCLFNLFINDLIHQTNSPTALFADDTLIYRPVNTTQDEQILQQDINRVHSWCVANKMRINIKKSKVMRITWSRNPGIPNYVYNETPLEIVNEYKYLGIIINNKLTWHTHVEYVFRKANRLLGFISSVSKSLSQSAFFSVYKSLVIPVLEYGQPVWQLHTSVLSNKLEQIQRRATRIALRQKRQEMSHPERLRLLNWNSLATRRKFCLTSYVIKSLFGYINCNTVRDGVSVNPRRDDTVKFVHLRARTQRLHCSAINAFPRLWEEFPLDLRSEVTVNSLSSWLGKLRRHLLLEI